MNLLMIMQGFKNLKLLMLLKKSNNNNNQAPMLIVCKVCNEWNLNHQYYYIKMCVLCCCKYDLGNASHWARHIAFFLPYSTSHTKSLCDRSIKTERLKFSQILLAHNFLIGNRFYSFCKLIDFWKNMFG